MALSDSEERVRRAATVRIIKDVDLKALSIKQRMDLVQCIMNINGESSVFYIMTKISVGH